ncbi:MFS general substrate transporter [Trichoderma citrinoviride]|uniref:MFS general substrate transporter n=1 Tax=Trichoderma citrinoviride TaxID=58853 RepID=A0A2T4BC16_9HYPO|nr:MFS general substrate transporter [Trichoderma citrinoviride]PTB66876.1 MFS general substrate transporter [Trichoderma citrinoviride]
MASHLPATTLSTKPESSETTPYDSSSLVEVEARDPTNIEEKPSPPGQTTNSFGDTSPQRLKESEDAERGQLPALNNTVSRATTISKKRAYTFMILIVLTQAVQMFAFGAGIVGALTVGHAIGASDPQSTWIAAAYPLTQGSFVLISGRLGTVFGHKRIMSIGSFIWIFWTLATAYGTNIVGVSFMRGLAGIGGGLLVPNAVALLTITFPPGRQRNLALALFASMGPVGGAGGCVFNGFFLQWTDWTWLFSFLAVLVAVVYGAAIIAVPEDERLDPGGKIDWVGSYLGVAGLVLFNFVWNQAPIVGWKNTYEYILLIVAIGHFAVFLIWETKWAVSPIIPFDIWAVPSFGALIIVLFFVFMSLGIYIWYVTVFLANLRNWDPVLLGCSFLPMAVSGTGAAFFAAWVVRRLPAETVVCISALGAVVMNTLLATMPIHQVYWAMVSIVTRRHQGTAGSLIGTLFTYGLSTGLGFAGTVEIYVNKDGSDLVAGYRGAAYLGIGLAAAAIVLTLLFLRMKKNTVEGWQGEDAGHSEPSS